jgi:peptidoglycan hydrolase-like protein with peptidoglycan-binding domain
MLRRALTPLVASIVATCCLTGTPATAVPDADVLFANAFFPTQSTGNRGVDVLAIQYLLNQAGQTVDTIGVFGPATNAAVRAFQSQRGLTVDGIAGPNTWMALVPVLRLGNTGPAVRALQVELNEKRRINLAVNGTFDAATDGAVRTFQQHAGIGVDGIVGQMTWRNLVWHYGYPDFTAGICDQDPDGNGTANWATGAAIGQLEQAVRVFAGTGQGQVPLGDSGFEHGGDIPGHASHDVGMDIDIWPIRTDNAQCTAGRITWQSATYDRAATRRLINEIRAAAPGHVRLIFFNDPTLISEGLTQPLDNHDNHLHVRYCEKGHPSSLYVC